jgi:hypothetical protein
MPSTVLGNQAITLPSDTTANRPTAASGILRQNTTNSSLETYNGSAWIQAGHPGSSGQNPASSAVQLYNLGLRGKDFYWLTSPNGGVVLNYCDLDTVDEDGVAGWILVAQFGSSSQWRNPGNSFRTTLDPNSSRLNENSQNDAYTRQWSANWGDYSINKFRIQMSESVQSGGVNSKGDWYYHWSTACNWKQVWTPAAGANVNYINDTTGDNAYNFNAFSGWPTPVNNIGTAIYRPCLRGFNWSYNIRHSYKLTTHRWNGLGDTGGGTAQRSPDFWTTLTTPTVNTELMYTGAATDDGSLAIPPSDHTTATTSGQDCDTGSNTKIGSADSGEIAAWTTTATGISVTSNGTVTGPYRYKAFFWIK